MAFSKFLSEKKAQCKALVEALSAYYPYVSVLGVDIKTCVINVNRKTTNVSEASDTDCGFVVKMGGGSCFYEYSLPNLEGDMQALAQRIHEGLVVSPLVASTCISSAAIEDKPLVKSFSRENDLENLSEFAIVAFCTDLRDRMLAGSDKVANAIALIRTQEVSKLFVTARRMLDQYYGWVNGALVATMRDEDKMVQVREMPDGNTLREVMSVMPTRIEALLAKGEKLLHATPIEPGVYDVITDPSVTGLIAHEAFGHGVEMDMFVKQRALARQFVGKYVASPIVNMRDGAGSALSVASYFFDDDGVLAGDTQIIKDGILVTGISDLISASQLGTAPTGNGRRQNHAHKAYSRMTNTFFEKGTSKLEDMIASIKHGYMIFETNNGMEDPKNWAIQCVAEYGIEIVDGKLTDHYVSPVVMSGYVPDVLKAISMVSDDFEISGSGSCGKGYKEWVRVSDGGPALKTRVKLG